MKLSERLEARLALRAAPTEITREPVYVDSPECRALLQEAAELARRVEDAPSATFEFGNHGGQSLHLRDADSEILLLRGQRVRIVPEAGQGGGE